MQLPIKVLNLPQTFCFQGSAGDIVSQIANSLVAEADGSISNVFLGNVEPINPQTTALWIRQDNSGTVISVNVFSGGKWVSVTKSLSQDLDQSISSVVLVANGDAATTPNVVMTFDNTDGVYPMNISVQYTILTQINVSNPGTGVVAQISVERDGGPPTLVLNGEDYALNSTGSPIPYFRSYTVSRTYVVDAGVMTVFTSNASIINGGGVAPLDVTYVSLMVSGIGVAV